ncbi:hypothetical protein WQ54_23855 [Bacillus sp. SA1-12]|uniref:lipase/acyltransferase domain-containing protein n=1 Tax=Bacillus sp. SA1-12 TaxID=1455638 RepID=UPI00062702B8|nr:alpha/beta hydrolase [Bacillus sp. SA1-12]KKI90135.1 hypothetical protein WQ54_23855 [Bacillus sp. SA1-12]
MKRHVLFIHSAGPQGLHQGSSSLFAYLQSALGPDHDLRKPELPNPENPEYELWKIKLEQELQMLKGDVILIGHSLGGSVLLKYLSEEGCNLEISGFFSIAAPYWGINEDWQRDDFILSENFSTKLPLIPKMYLYHSRHENIVPFAHLEHYIQKLPESNIRVIEGDSHLFQNGLPEFVKDIKNFTSTSSG